jgi:hypothetical protein
MLHDVVGVCCVADRQFFAMSWLSRVVYMIICTSMNRVKYYFAWKLGEFVSAVFGVMLGGTLVISLWAIQE